MLEMSENPCHLQQRYMLALQQQHCVQIQASESSTTCHTRTQEYVDHARHGLTAQLQSTEGKVCHDLYY
jgi:hypothetical protein